MKKTRVRKCYGFVICYSGPILINLSAFSEVTQLSWIYNVPDAEKKGHSFVPHTPRLGGRQMLQKNGQHSVPRQPPSEGD